MLPYRRESPALPRCPVRGGRVVHGPQFAYCPSPQGRCPQPSSSSSSPSPCRVQLCCWPYPGPGGAQLSCAGGPLQGWGHNAGAPSPQLCTGCRVPTPAPSPSVRCLALTMASPAPAPPGAWARAGSGTSWIRCPGRGPGWAWMSCRSQVRPPGGGHTGWGAAQRPARGTQRGLGVPGLGGARRPPALSLGLAAIPPRCPVVPVLVLAPQLDPQHSGLPTGRTDPQLPGVPRAEARGNRGSQHRAFQGGRRWRGPGEWWHGWGHESCPTRGTGGWYRAAGALGAGAMLRPGYNTLSCLVQSWGAGPESSPSVSPFSRCP